MKKKKLKTISFKIVDVALFADNKAAKDTINIDDEFSDSQVHLHILENICNRNHSFQYQSVNYKKLSHS